MEAKKLIDRALIYSLIVAIVGAGLKLMHLQGANVTLINGLGSLAVVSFIKYAYERTFVGYITGAAIALGCIAVVFKLMHWDHADWLVDAAIAVAIVWAIASFRSKGEEQ